ncbi:MAG: dienelactone hydrolase family protein [Thermodesulfobacteriota bacterium]
MHRIILAVALFALTATHAAAAVIGEPVDYLVGDKRFTGYLARDDGQTAKRPGVLVVHEWWGHNDYARKRARMLAELGYVALALDMYGDGRQAAHPQEASAFSSSVRANLPEAKERFLAAMRLLQEQPGVDPARIGAIGYCFGGGIVLEMARQGLDLAAVVSFHGALATEMPAAPGTIKARILVCNGGADGFVKPEQIAAFIDEMRAAEAAFVFASYPGAKHSFTNPEADGLAAKFKLPIAYDEKADQQSWNDMRSLLADVFANRK